ncbi:MAG TPA: hypothetical protein VMG10_07890 [Gemmataceae bacterium]|nr:hypothetical protein [Gemmataceae bacterium]
MHVPIHWIRKQEILHWSWGYCESCQQYGPIRLKHFLDVLYFYFVVPLCKRKGQSARCDFCRRSVERVVDPIGINLADWSPKEGLLSLLTKLGLPIPISLPRMCSDERLHSLLSSIDESSSLARVTLRPRGILAGLVIGALAPVSLALLHDNKLVQLPRGKGELVILLSLAGIPVGLLLGGLIEFFLQRDRSAVRRIKEACEDYQLDLYRLEELSHIYSQTVQIAVKTACEDALRGW